MAKDTTDDEIPYMGPEPRPCEAVVQGDLDQFLLAARGCGRVLRWTQGDLNVYLRDSDVQGLALATAMLFDAACQLGWCAPDDVLFSDGEGEQ